MRKKIISLVLSLVLCVGLFTGCSLFTFNTERDNMTVIATVAASEYTYRAPSLDNSDVMEDRTWTSPERTIYKYEVVNYINSNSSNYTENDTAESIVKAAVDGLTQNYVILNQVESEINFGTIILSQHEKNETLKYIYKVIDNELASYENEILKENGLDAANPTTTDTDPTANTTYPVQSVKEIGKYDNITVDDLKADLVSRIESFVTEANVGENYKNIKQVQLMIADSYNNQTQLVSMLERYDTMDVEAWTPELTRYPGLYGDYESKSLETSAFGRFLQYLANLVDDDYRMMADQKTQFADELKAIEKVRSEKGTSYAYPELAKSELMYFLAGKSYHENQLVQLLSNSMVESVNVTNAEIQKTYDTTKAEQESKYSDASAYETDVKGGNVSPMIYYANDDYYFVKHILIPFSESQTAELTAYKNTYDPNTNGSEEKIKEKKESLAKQIMSYEHRDGEDYGQKLTINQIYSDITATMARYTSMEDRDKAFTSLIYKYNTDTGIFGNELGYAVKNVRDYSGNDKVYDETYMVEFSLAAKDLYEFGNLGDMSGWAVTDYGVHILFLSKTIGKNGETLGINDYISVAKTNSVKSTIKENLLNDKLDKVFSKKVSDWMGKYNIKGAELIKINDKEVDRVVKDITG